MRFGQLIAALALLVTTPAGASVVFEDPFDAEGPGTSITNYTGFANFTVVDGSVDLVRQGDFGLACPGGSGSSCIDLDGSSGKGGTLQSRPFSFGAGATVTISFDIGGNQRTLGYDQFFGFLVFPTAVNLANFGIDYYGAPVDYGPFTDLGSIGASGLAYGSEPFNRRSLYFTAAQGGDFYFRIGTTSEDNQGPLLDNVRVDIASNAVPEPGAWMMMIGGFVMLGGAVRRRRAFSRKAVA